jgi:hypothetical protein
MLAQLKDQKRREEHRRSRKQLRKHRNHTKEIIEIATNAQAGDFFLLSRCFSVFSGLFSVFSVFHFKSV